MIFEQDMLLKGVKNKKMENIYDILFSIFIGIIIIVALKLMHDFPRTIVLHNNEKENFIVKNKQCNYSCSP
jgi:hypothetical protein